jgi:hypothetical protein
VRVGTATGELRSASVVRDLVLASSAALFALRVLGEGG